jgi:Small Multidrug Resistance (SMR) protein
LRHGLDLPNRRRSVRDRLGDRPKIHGWLYPPAAVALDRRQYDLSIVLLGLALKTLPVGTAYAVWTGIGAVGTATLGIYLFAEPATALRLICIGLILSGIVGLKLVT